MPVREILTAEQPVLRQKAKKVKKVDAALQKLVDDMIETMEAAPGQGLAAPQIGVSLRVIVVDARPGEDDEDEIPVQLQLINPEIVDRHGTIRGEEGCLSIPGFIGYVTRAEAITVKGLNRRGREVKLRATKNLARVLQHEIDHIDGVLFTDRLEHPEDLFRLNDQGERIPVFDKPAAPVVELSQSHPS